MNTANWYLLSLSSYLYTATSNQTYQAAAELSAEFIWNVQWNGEVILDTTDLGACGTNSEILQSYNSGWTIEGLANIVSYNSTWRPQ